VHPTSSESWRQALCYGAASSKPRGNRPGSCGWGHCRSSGQLRARNRPRWSPTCTYRVRLGIMMEDKKGTLLVPMRMGIVVQAGTEPTYMMAYPILRANASTCWHRRVLYKGPRVKTRGWWAKARLPGYGAAPSAKNALQTVEWLGLSTGHALRVWIVDTRAAWLYDSRAFTPQNDESMFLALAWNNARGAAWQGIGFENHNPC